MGEQTPPVAPEPAPAPPQQLAAAVSEKSPNPWVVKYFYSVINELCYGGIMIAIKCDKAPELQLLRRQVSARRSSATVRL